MGDVSENMLPGDLGRIADVVGIEAAIKIAEHFKGTVLYVPGLHEFKRRVRDEHIRRDYDRGLRVEAIAMKHDVSTRTVRYALNRPSEKFHEVVFRLIG